MRILKIIFYCLFLLLIIVNQCIAQEYDEDNLEQKEKEFYLFWGGSLWLGFGSNTYVDVNLVFGTQITKRINVGVSGKYQYIKNKSPYGDFKTSVYGGSVFTQIAIIEDFRNLVKVKGHSGIIAHIEYEFLNTDYNYIFFDEPADISYDRYWLHNILIGGGYVQQIGPKSKTYIILLWNVYDIGNNPYEYPQLRIGFTLGI